MSSVFQQEIKRMVQQTALEERYSRAYFRMLRETFGGSVPVETKQRGLPFQEEDMVLAAAMSVCSSVEKAIEKAIELAIVGNIEKAIWMEVVNREYPITFVPSLQEMIEVGNYDSVDKDMTSNNFPLENKGVIHENTCFVSWDRDVETEEVLSSLDSKNLRPAKIINLLGLGARYPWIQLMFGVVALDSVLETRPGVPVVPCLRNYKKNTKRDLGFYRMNGKWKSRTLFLAVPK